MHGAGGGGWAWDLVTAELDKLGIAHRAVDLPSCGSAPPPDAGVAGDTAMVRELLDTFAGPVVLVGNSYGGVIISAAAVDHPAVARLVYIAADMPEAGIPLVNQLSGNEESRAAADPDGRRTRRVRSGSSGSRPCGDPPVLDTAMPRSGLPRVKSDPLDRCLTL